MGQGARGAAQGESDPGPGPGERGREGRARAREGGRANLRRLEQHLQRGLTAAGRHRIRGSEEEGREQGDEVAQHRHTQPRMRRCTPTAAPSHVPIWPTTDGHIQTTDGHVPTTDSHVPAQIVTSRLQIVTSPLQIVTSPLLMGYRFHTETAFFCDTAFCAWSRGD